MRLCNSARVRVGFEVLVVDTAGVGEVAGATAGDCDGDATGIDRGVGEGLGVAGVVDLRSRCALLLKDATGIAASTRNNERNSLQVLISIN